MSPQRWQQINQLFEQAVPLPVEQRAAFLAQACDGDETLCNEVLSLLAADANPDALVAQPLGAVAADLWSDLPSTAPLPAAVSGTQLGTYQILQELGRGGMGEVYLAQDQKLGRRVALKLLPTGFTHDPERLHRFRQEARAASALNHPNIVTIFDIGAQDGRHFMATEYVEGQTLRTLLKRERLTPGQALDIAIQVASALEAAHQAGIIHRDIKPENIMIRPDGYVKVLDFGLAKLTEPRSANSGEASDGATLDSSRHLSFETRSGVVLGTVSYMSPEQGRGQKVDVRTDIFSLGVVLYEILTGQRPFEGATPNHVLVAILDMEPAPLAHTTPGAPTALQGIVTRALQKDRAERYQTVTAMLSELRSLKREVEFSSQLPDAEVLDTSGQLSDAATTQKADTNEMAAAHRTSAAAFLAARFNRYRRAAYVALLLIVLVTGIAFYRHTTRPAAIDSIAVLPFTNQNHAPEMEYLADGLTENIINKLTQLAGLRIIHRSSVFRYKSKVDDPFRAAKDLGVRAVVVGRVLQRGENLTISAELIDVQANKQLWGEQYTRKLADIFAVQEEIAREISEKLRAKLSGTELQRLAKRSTENFKAFQAYLQGRSYAHRRTRDDLLTAIRHYEQAIVEDPNYALAYTGLAEAYGTLGVFGLLAPIESRRKMEEAVHTALRLDENLAEAQAALGLAYVQFAPYDFGLAEHALQRALELSPSSAVVHQNLSYALVRQGRFDECLTEMLKARELDPLSSVLARNVAYIHYFKRDYTRALELLRQANQLGPALSSATEIGIYIQNRLFDEALAEIAQAKRERKNDPILIFSTGLIYAAQGERTAARQIIKELEKFSGASLNQALNIAKIYAVLNEQEAAFAWLERGLAAGAIGHFMKDEWVWDSIRYDARFAALLQRMGFPQ